MSTLHIYRDTSAVDPEILTDKTAMAKALHANGHDINPEADAHKVVGSFWAAASACQAACASSVRRTRSRARSMATGLMSLHQDPSG